MMKNLTRSILLLLLFLRLVGAQTAVPSGSIDGDLAIEDPAARITALQKRLKSIASPSDTQTVLEAIVASRAQMGEKRLADNYIDQATSHFRRAIAELPQTISDRFFNDTVIRIPQATSMRGYRLEAIDLARLLEKRFAGEPARLLALGEYYTTIEAPTDAIRVLEAAVKLNEQDGQARRMLGAAYRLGLRLDDAIHEYQLAIAQSPKDRRGWYELGNLYRAHGAYSDAISLYRSQLEVEPKHLSAYKGLALACLAGGYETEFLSAMRKLDESSEATDNIRLDIYFQTQLAFLNLKMGRLTEARQAAEAALVIEPRYAWARIAAAEVEMAEGRYFEAERNLLAAQQYASFPTLAFTLGKLYLTAEDFDGAIEQFGKAFHALPNGRFQARLGGSLDIESDDLSELLSREHQAAIFIAASPTSPETFRIAEALVRLNDALQNLGHSEKSGTTVTLPTDSAHPIDQLAGQFLGAESSRRIFRALYLAQRLVNSPAFSGKTIELADQVLGMAEDVTELEGSLRDYPNYDRNGRLRIVRGRALDLKGWALFKAGYLREAQTVLLESIRSYGVLPEVKRALWHLGTVKEAGGDFAQALDLYIAGYQPPPSQSIAAKPAGTEVKRKETILATPAGSAATKDVNLSIIELLYRRVNGSLDGLEAKLKLNAEGLPGDLMAELIGGDQVYLPPISANQSNRSENAQASQSQSAGETNPPDPGRELLRIRDRESRSGSSRTSGKPTILLPRTDPMFAKPGERQSVAPPKREEPLPESRPAVIAEAKPVAQSVEMPTVSAPSTPVKPVPPESAQTEPTRVEPVTVEPAPAPNPLVPVVLPELIPLAITLTDPLSPLLNQQRFFARWERLRFTPDFANLEAPPEPPPAGPAPATRKRRVTTVEPPDQN